MDFQKFLSDFATVFVVILVVHAIVTFLWSLIFHGAGTVDWGLSLGLAIGVGIALAWISARESKGKEK